MTYSNPYADTRPCESCGADVEIEGSTYDASGTCPDCDETIWVNHDEELSDYHDERLIDAARDARFDD